MRHVWLSLRGLLAVRAQPREDRAGTVLGCLGLFGVCCLLGSAGIVILSIAHYRARGTSSCGKKYITGRVYTVFPGRSMTWVYLVMT